LQVNTIAENRSLAHKIAGLVARVSCHPSRSSCPNPRASFRAVGASHCSLPSLVFLLGVEFRGRSSGWHREVKLVPTSFDATFRWTGPSHKPRDLLRYALAFSSEPLMSFIVPKRLILAPYRRAASAQSAYGLNRIGRRSTSSPCPEAQAFLGEVVEFVHHSH
jgi:hypothetical protein